MLRVAQPLVCLTLPAIGFASTLGELYAVVGLFGLLLGAVDATMNMQGAITEKRYGYSVITAFYSGWSAAGILGGLWNAAAGKLGLSLGTAFAVAAAVGLAGALISGRLLFSRAEDVAPVSEAAARAAGISIPWRPIIGIGIAPPQCFSATAKLDPTGSGIAISRVNLFNYAGFVLGAALAGGVAGVAGGPAGWRTAYAAPLLLTLVIVLLARGFAPAPAAAVVPVPLAGPADAG